MDQMIDRSGMFEDFNFKLLVIDSILDKNPSFERELNELKEKYVDTYEWYQSDNCIKEMLSFFENLELSGEDLAKVTEICFDGGEDIYFLLKPDWDGETDIFDVVSVNGFEQLSNLTSVEYISMCNPKLMEIFRENGIKVNE